jgi:hypothetical protein
MSGRSGLGELVAAQGLTGGPGGVQRVGLGAVAAGGSLGPVQLHHPLGLGLQEPGQASNLPHSSPRDHTRAGGIGTDRAAWSGPEPAETMLVVAPVSRWIRAPVMTPGGGWASGSPAPAKGSQTDPARANALELLE